MAQQAHISVATLSTAIMAVHSYVNRLHTTRDDMESGAVQHTHDAYKVISSMVATSEDALRQLLLAYKAATGTHFQHRL